MNTIFHISGNVLTLAYSYEGQDRSKRFYITNIANADKISHYIQLSEPKRVYRNCMELVDAGILETRESLLEGMI